MKWITHDYIRYIQESAIRQAKENQEKESCIFHFDFAENWTAILPNEVQSYHWHKRQVSIFTCVVTRKQSIQSFAVISDDTCHDAAHACFALQIIHNYMKEQLKPDTHVTYVSDGACSHFKNKYQLFELCQKDHISTKWIFSATGHGKNSCDGVGGLLKHQATLYNLRAASSAVIMSASQMVAQMSAKLKNVKLLCANADELETFRQFKKSQWKSLPRVPGIRSWHVWLSTSEGTDRGRVLLASRTAKCDLQKMQPF